MLPLDRACRVLKSAIRVAECCEGLFVSMSYGEGRLPWVQIFSDLRGCRALQGRRLLAGGFTGVTKPVFALFREEGCCVQRQAGWEGSNILFYRSLNAGSMD